MTESAYLAYLRRGGEASKVGGKILVVIQKREIPGGNMETKSALLMVMFDMNK